MGINAARPKLGSSLTERIGLTPLVRLDQIARAIAGVQLLGKAEWANPGGSVKDRAAASMVADARDRGLLMAGKTILDATSGNTGIAFAMLGAALGIPVQLAMPAVSYTHLVSPSANASSMSSPMSVSRRTSSESAGGFD